MHCHLNHLDGNLAKGRHMMSSLTTGHFRVRVLFQIGIKYSIADLIAHFIW